MYIRTKCDAEVKKRNRFGIINGKRVHHKNTQNTYLAATYTDRIDMVLLLFNEFALIER